MTSSLPLLLASLLSFVVSCGGGSPSPANLPTTPSIATAEPRELPEYPDVIEAGVSGGAEPIAMMISNDPVDAVRAFYFTDALAAFERLEGDATEVEPLHVRDVAARRDYFIAVYEQDGITMIRIATTTH